MAHLPQHHKRRRRLIVDTDLGLDDLVALAILRLQQCVLTHQTDQQEYARHHTNFRICGVTLTSGISVANHKNAALLSQLLPPGTPIYVGNTCKSLKWNSAGTEKPPWWGRTANKVQSFLSSLPAAETPYKSQQITAEEYIATNLNDPDTDILCMAPLTNIAAALDLFKSKHPSNRIQSQLYVMGGIKNDSKWSKRGESTAPFGYHDKFAGTEDAAQTAPKQSSDEFGEFNFALNIDAARRVLTSASSHIITLEGCTLVPASLRKGDKSANLASVLAQHFVQSESMNELLTARNNLLWLLNEFGTNETQWDSISAVVYCNVFPRRNKLLRVGQTEWLLSDLGAFTFHDQPQLCTEQNSLQGSNPISHLIHPAFTIDDEQIFYDFLASILFGGVALNE